MENGGGGGGDEVSPKLPRDWNNLMITYTTILQSTKVLITQTWPTPKSNTLYSAESVQMFMYSHTKNPFVVALSVWNSRYNDDLNHLLL